MNRSQATTGSHIISAGVAAAPLATSVTRARVFLARLLAAACLLLPAAASAQQVNGERLFRQRCGTCHSLEPGQNRVGPHLSGVIGRTAASVEGGRYSAALRESGIVWESGTLDAFLTAPRQAVPGTSMTVGVPNAAQRAAIIVYLEGAITR
ncbi:c-type cytochrome [Mesorhizobium sp. M9A.F.Ca.ET.002.03.1.2]|uniref:c-type cytochrome n=1 Tax=Mesorhizobium sp. M9A.F.Ca.ET.002.03.1.2 TaxID=2493668 RepID=UPI000F75428A|nr:c-type cytochrome [Mesorhizobium sp. M9A.F.Ca.ET.002.03.1.2]AZN98306.1 c-type cytochrome [Mesorhizobium sp. M9A.F.Ca.ET.002.03.1.2]